MNGSEVLDYIGEYIKDNNPYLNSFTVNGIQLPSGEVIKFTDNTEKSYIGVADNVGTHGYIRYNPQITHNQNERRLSSLKWGSYSKRCRLVAFTFMPEPTSEHMMTKLVSDLKRIPFTTSRQKPVITIRQSNHNYLDILTEEMRGNVAGGVTFSAVSIDFDLKYFEGECENC